MDQLAAGLFGIVGVGALGGMYFAPTIAAGMRHHHQTGPIAIINFFLGWTLLGWVVAMAMAASPTRTPAGTSPFPAPAWPPPNPYGERHQDSPA